MQRQQVKLKPTFYPLKHYQRTPQVKTRNISQPTIAVVGFNMRTKDVIESLDDLPVNIIRFSTTRNLSTKLPAHTLAVVFVHPVLGLKRGLESVAKAPHLKDAHVHVIGANQFSADKAIKLYKLGADAVARFPGDRMIYAEMVDKLVLEPAMHGKDMSKPKDKINHVLQVRSEIATENPQGETEKVRMHWRGKTAYVIPLGFKVEQESFKKIREALIKAPSVESVQCVDQNNSIDAQGFSHESDLLQEMEVSKALEHTPNIPDRALFCSIRQNKAVLAGHVESKEQLREAVNAIEKVTHFQKLTNLVTIGAQKAQNSQRIAGQLQGKIEALAETSNVHVSKVGDLVVLTGTIPKQAMQRVRREIFQRFPYRFNSKLVEV